MFQQCHQSTCAADLGDQTSLTCTCRSALSKKDRKAYIKAVQCLRELPSRGPPEWNAAKTRYDDFVAQHVDMTIEVHGSGPFLTWHRAFVWSYETALIDECGYKGAQPVSNPHHTKPMDVMRR